MASSGKDLSSLTVRSLWMAAAVFFAARLPAQDAKPLPPVAELRQRAADNYAKTTAARERYLCRSKVTTEELDKNGSVKKAETVEREVFFVKGQEISQRISTNGQPLTPDEIRKRDEHVKKAIENADAGKKTRDQINVSDVLRLARLENERRVPVNGRPTIVFDMMPDPNAKTHDLAQRFVADMAGTLSIDEATGQLQDANLRGVNDIKVAGGLLANVHKGFRLHVVTAPQPDGVWLVRLAEGQGDARLGLFLSRAGRFHQETEGCRLYDVNSDQKNDTVHPSSK